MTPDVGLVLTADPWVQRFHRHCADHGGVRIRAVVIDAEAAREEDFDVLVAARTWSGLTGGLVDDLRRTGRRVLVVDGGDAAPVDLVRRVREVADGDDARAVVGSGRGAIGVEVERVGTPESGPSPTLPAARGAAAGSRPALVCAVAGPSGTGVTEVALGLGAAAARAGVRVVVVDLDVWAPGVAARLGLPVEPGLEHALAAVALDPARVLGAVFDLGRRRPAVVAGLRSPRAPGDPAPEVGGLLAALAPHFDVVVCDLGADPPWASSILGADPDLRSVTVGLATPAGVHRLATWSDGRPAGTDGVTVLTRAPRPSARRSAVRDALAGVPALAGVSEVEVPVDRRVEDAIWAADLPGRGAFTQAMDRLWRVLAVPFGGARVAR